MRQSQDVSSAAVAICIVTHDDAGDPWTLAGATVAALSEPAR